MIITFKFSYEILAAILVIAFILILSFEYLWLYIISRKNEEVLLQKRKINLKIHAMIEAVMYSPTASSRKAELDSILNYIGQDPDKKDEAANQFIELMRRQNDIPPEKIKSLEMIYKAIDPIAFYSTRLEQGNKNEKGYAARKLADFGATEKITEIRKLLDSKNTGLVYNCAMALAELADEQSTLLFLKKCENNRRYSHRVLLELLQTYTGDREKIVRSIFENCNNYIKTAAIKAYTDDCIANLADLYIESMSSKDINLKIASVKALAQIGKPEYEHKMIVALNDKNWVVRLAAVSGLEKIGTQTALKALVDATQDDEWWVRNAAARAIVKIDFYLVYVEKVLSGYDKYAADAVKNALYKQIKMTGGDFS